MPDTRSLLIRGHAGWRAAALALAGLALSSLSCLQAADPWEMDRQPPTAVRQVDLQRYVGQWYEIAKIPNRFQRRCAGGTTATYSLRPDGRLEVLNRCLDGDGRAIEARGIAKVVDAESNARLEVSFVRLLGVSLFWGDYWIIGLDEDYQFAVVGTPNRKYGWILGRRPALEENELERAFATLREQGYDPSEFEFTVQSWSSPR